MQLGKMHNLIKTVKCAIMNALFLQPNTGDRSSAIGLAAFPKRVDYLASPIGEAILFPGQELLIAELG